jgi:hypothetical protein
MAIELTFFEQTHDQVEISTFGRKMMWASESGEYLDTVPLEIINAFSRVGEELAETASTKRLTKADHMVIKYAKRLLG